jgi:hypothetical protein
LEETFSSEYSFIGFLCEKRKKKPSLWLDSRDFYVKIYEVKKRKEGCGPT